MLRRFRALGEGARVHRVLASSVLIGLLVGLPVAFLVTQRLKLTRSPIAKTRLIVATEARASKPTRLEAFSPVCRCRSSRIALQFWLRHSDKLTVDVMQGRKTVVRRLIDDRWQDGGRNTFVWNGRTDSGSLAADGLYHFQVRLDRARRTILIPNPIKLDTQSPRIVEAKAARPSFSPDGDGKADGVVIDYKLSEPARAVLYVRGKPAVVTFARNAEGSLIWRGQLGGRTLRPDTYPVRLAAVDAAGNRTAMRFGALLDVNLRYIALRRHRLSGVDPRARFAIAVDTDAEEYGWRFNGIRGKNAGRLLTLEAPRRPGDYQLVVSAGGRTDRATISVRPR